MQFMNPLRAFLRRVERGEAPPAPGGPPALSNALRRELAGALREKAAGMGASEAASLLVEWGGEAIETFAETLSRRLKASLLFDPDAPEDVDRAVVGGFRALLELPTPWEGGLLLLEAQHIARELNEELLDRADTVASDQALSAYCFENRLTTPGAPTLTPAARVLCAQPGRDGIRWLLEVERAQSCGPDDTWRLHPLAAQHLVVHRAQGGTKYVWSDGDKHELAWPWDVNTLRRLAALGLLNLTERESSSAEPLGFLGYELTSLGLELLAEIADDDETPFRLLARTLLQDDATRRLVDTSGLPLPIGAATTETAIRQARMVAHEVRNALVPVQVAAQLLFRKAQLADPGGDLQRHKERIDAGLGRVFDFVRQLLDTAALAESAPAPFDLLAALRDAVAAVRPDAGPATHIEARLPAALPRLAGSRERFTLAVVNLLRNAVQVLNGAGGTVTLEADSQGDAVEVRVADDGPGIPPELRDTVFLPGFSSKTSGTGFGLSLAREVVGEMGGTLVHRDAVPHGAVFVVRIPRVRKDGSA